MYLVELGNFETMAHVPSQVAEAIPKVEKNGEGKDKLGGEDEDRADAESLDHAQVVRVRAWENNCTQSECGQDSRLHQTGHPEKRNYTFVVNLHIHDSVLMNLCDMESMLVSWNL